MYMMLKIFLLKMEQGSKVKEVHKQVRDQRSIQAQLLLKNENKF